MLLATTIVLIAMLFYTYSYINRMLPTVIIVGLTDKFHIDAASLGILSAFFYWAYTLMQLPTGVLFDRLGVRRMMILAVMGVTFGSLLFAYAPILGIAELSRFIMGLASAFAYIGVLKLAVIWMPQRYFAVIAGLTSSVGMVGTMIFVIMLNNLVQDVGMHDATVLVGFLGILITLLVFIFVRDRKHNPDLPAVAPMTLNSVIAALGFMLRNKNMWLIGVIGFCLYSPINSFSVLWGIPYLQSAFNFSQQEATYGITTLIVGFAIGGPIIAGFSNRIANRKIPLILSGFLTAACFILLVYSGFSHASFVFVVLFIIGFFSSAQALVFPLANEYNPSKVSATATALTNMFQTLGGTFLLPLLGVIMNMHHHAVTPQALSIGLGDYQFALLVLPIILVIAGILAFFIKETHASHLHD